MDLDTYVKWGLYRLICVFDYLLTIDSLKDCSILSFTLFVAETFDVRGTGSCLQAALYCPPDAAPLMRIPPLATTLPRPLPLPRLLPRPLPRLLTRPLPLPRP
jgi:hypothetical protein